jgi:homoserine dehydrogenase
LVILIKHAFGLTVNERDVLNYGIRHIKNEDVQFAKEKGLRIKLFARAQKLNNKIVGFVAPHFIKSDHPAYEVNNEFNAVVVEAAFSDRQLFMGKGAGSFPTASAVLSDVSALLYEYKYEYRKTELVNADYSNEFKLRVYVGASKQELIENLPFQNIEELYRSETYVYQIGWMNFKDVQSLNLNDNAELSLIVFPDGIKN